MISGEKPKYYSKLQVAEMLTICIRGVERLIAAGKLEKIHVHAVGVKGRVAIVAASVDRLLKERGGIAT
ncbi:MAG: hypothetical protein IT444_12325 [Phycisphaeraceae bacterium]|nr:hypothetical protein [Phycisphaeraceae bacterium]